MRFLLLLFLALGAGIGLTMFAENPGYVLLTREPWTFETSLTIFCLALLIVFILFYLMVRLLDNFINSPAKLRRWKQQRNRQQAIEDTRLGIFEAINGSWLQAEKRLKRKLLHSPQPEINLLTAAWIAQQQDEQIKRDDYIAKASACSSKKDDAQLSIGLVHCTLQEQGGQVEQALAKVQSLHQQAPANPAVIRCLARLLNETEQWDELLSLLTIARRHHALKDTDISSMQSRAAIGLLGAANSLMETEADWKNLPRKLRQRTVVISSYCRALMRFNRHQEAEALIRHTLKNDWCGELVELYGQLKTKDPAAQLKHAETWLPEHQTNTTLMLCMGRLAIQNKLWGMARSYLEVAVQNRDNIAAFLELAWLFESLGEKDAALETYKDGLETSLKSRQQDISLPPQQSSQTPGEMVEPEQDSDHRAQPPSLAYSNESK